MFYSCSRVHILLLEHSIKTQTPHLFTEVLQRRREDGQKSGPNGSDDVPGGRVSYYFNTDLLKGGGGDAGGIAEEKGLLVPLLLCSLSNFALFFF